MSNDNPSNPLAVVDRLHRALNRHDLPALLALFADDYASSQPAHPARSFRGRQQVKKNWSTILSSVPDLHVELLSTSVTSDTVWSEWDWTGTQVDGEPLHLRGVIIMGVRDGLIAWGRLYMEDVDEDGGDIDDVVRQMTGKCDRSG
jgi:ketosteroid isomerase-like protein